MKGQMGGHDAYELTVAQMPAHTHVASLGSGVQASVEVKAKSGAGNQNNAGGAGKYWATAQTGGMSKTDVSNQYADSHDVTMAADAVSVTVTGTDVEVEPAGAGAQFDNRSPYLGLDYIICVNGMYPERN